MTRNATRRSRAAAIGLGALLCGGSGEAFARLIEVTNCGGRDAPEAGARYVLTNDIDCAGEIDPFISMARGSVLELGGYTLSDGDVVCSGKCRVVGPGTIRGGGVISDDKVTLLRTTITGSPSNGVLAINAKGRGRATIIDSVIDNCATTGVEADRMTKIIRSKIVGNGRHGVSVSLQTFNDCKRGRIRSLGSEVSGNGVHVTCGIDEVCADVASCARRGASLRGTGCNTSYELGSGMPGRSCGVCTLD